MSKRLNVAEMKKMKNERDDCVVYSMSQAANIKYDIVHKEFKKLGRKRRGFTYNYMIDQFLSNHKLRQAHLGDWDEHGNVVDYAKTVPEVLAKLKSREGSFVVMVTNDSLDSDTGHMFSVVNGWSNKHEVKDWLDAKVVSVSEVMSESEFNKLNFVGQNDLNWSQLLKSS
jgi:hypothetical protein